MTAMHPFLFIIMSLLVSCSVKGDPNPGKDSPAEILFTEDFESTDLASKGWYDNTNPAFSTTDNLHGSSRSRQMRFLKGGTAPVQGGAMRKLFDESGTLYVAFNVKYSQNWQGSGVSYHPHEIHVLTNKNDTWSGPAFTRLTTYIENSAGKPRVALQDGQNIDQARIGVNLVSTTENRSLMGCNGDSDGYGKGDCYDAGGGTYNNGKVWTASGKVISRGEWHRIEVFYRLNSVVAGKGVADGIMKYWLDGELIFDLDHIMYRTAQNHDMKFNQLVIAPWIGPGSPIEQTIWYDNLVVATSKPEN